MSNRDWRRPSDSRKTARGVDPVRPAPSYANHEKLPPVPWVFPVEKLAVPGGGYASWAVRHVRGLSRRGVAWHPDVGRTRVVEADRGERLLRELCGESFLGLRQHGPSYLIEVHKELPRKGRMRGVGPYGFRDDGDGELWVTIGRASIPARALAWRLYWQAP